MHLHWDVLWNAFVEDLPLLGLMLTLSAVALGFGLWTDSKRVIRRYAFRADLTIQKGCPTIYQGLHIIIPARSLEQAKVLADKIGAIHDTCPTYDPEFSH